jgi:hypothetical protein
MRVANFLEEYRGNKLVRKKRHVLLSTIDLGN